MAKSLQGLLMVALFACFGDVAQADNWPSWRGPQGNGLCAEKHLPTDWSPTQNVAWKLPLPGPAGSTPIVWKEQIFLTSVNDAGELLLIAIGTDGKQQWQHVVSVGNQIARGDEGNSASPSPLTDGRYVWAMMGDGTLACFTLDGRAVWKLNLQERYGKFNIQFGMSSTPVLDEGKLYLQLIHGDGNPQTQDAYVLCLDATNGKEIWRVDRPSDAEEECEHSYASPIIYRDSEIKLLLSHGGDYTVAHDLRNGQEIWRCGGLNRRDDTTLQYDKTLRFVASPVSVPGIIVIPSAKQHPVIAIHPDGQGDITSAADKHYWQWKKTPDVPSPLIVDDLVYLCMENGVVTVLEATSGREVYTQSVHRQRHRASPVYADGKVYLTGRDGKTSVIQAGREFKLLATNDLGEDQSSSPAIANGTLYLRTFQHLWAIRTAK